MYTRQKDIAERTGFSINTISLALRGSNRISDETKKKINKIARELNYIPDDVARSLVERKTKTIGVILTEITNPILTDSAQQIEKRLAENGFTMLLLTTGRNYVNEAKALDLLIARRVDGILMYPCLPSNLDKISDLRKRNHPVILLGFGEYFSSTDVVYIDKAKGAFKATEHLAKMGHKRIAFINGGVIGDDEKLNGYKKALETYHCVYEPELVIQSEGFGYEYGYKSAARIFEKNEPTAIFASRDYLAMGALRWCRENGLRIPEDVAIVGSDDIEAARFAEVPLTTVNYPVDKVTTQATDILFKLLSSKEKLDSIKPEKIAIEPGLVIRKSCGYRQ